MDSMKEYCPPLEGTSEISATNNEHNPPMRSDTWIVEKILRHEKRNGKLYWQVKWQDSDTLTWKPANSFIGDIQNDWLLYNSRVGLEVPLRSFVSS